MSDTSGKPAEAGDQRLLDAVKARLDQSEQALDGVTLGRLRAARREALATLGAERPRRTWWEPMRGLAVAATLATLTVSLWSLSPGPTDTGLMPLEDLALLTDSEDLEFYQDLDFYLWLDSRESANGDAEPVGQGGQPLGRDRQTG